MATPNPEVATPGGRKRPQPHDDTDAAAAPDIKKRKVDGDKDLPTPAGFNSLSAALSNGLANGHGSKVAPGPAASTGIGPPITSQPPAGSPNKPRPAIKLAALRGTIWDNEEKPRLASPSPRKKKTPVSVKARATGGTPRGRTPKSVTDSPSKPRSVGRPKGSTNKPKPVPVSLPPTSETDEEDDDDDDDAQSNAATPRKQGMPAKRLWGTPSALTPKGILSPSKNRNQTPKSVKFDGKTAGGGDGEVFFEDLPKSSAKKTTTTPRKPREPAMRADDIRCGICNKTNSRKPNQIILCDNCDWAVHQLCYDVPEIPEGDWLCKSCSQEDALAPTPKKDGPAAAPVAVAAPVEVPDIPNLETHLRAMQRVLLDRCAGRRRINMFGLQEVEDKARQIVEQTVVAGEGNSMLLIGARGSGKTTVCRVPDIGGREQRTWC